MRSGLKIQSPKAMVKEEWFLEAIKEVPDYLYVSFHARLWPELMHSVLVGHMPVRGNDADFGLIIDSIREQHPDVPVFVFGTSLSCGVRTGKLMTGGHTHVRDCVQFDDRSIG